MARHKSAAPENKETPVNLEVVDAERSAANELALIHTEQNERVVALAKKLDYKGSTDPAVLENSAQDAMRRLGATIFELGAYLLLMKEACPHGKFLPALERLDLGVDTAQRYMQVTRRFANTASGRYLETAGIKKMVELLPLDNEQLDALESLGQTGELALDDVARMSVKELRQAVRKVRQEKDRLKKVAEETHAEVIQLKLERKVVAHTDWPDALVPLTDQVAAAGRKIAQGVSELEACRLALFAAGVDLPEEDRVRFEAAIGHVADVYQEALARAERGIEKERLTFDQTLGGLAGGAA